jgi:type II secretory pathway pseudopilin PulG
MKFRRNNFYSAQSAFTMVEIAISLAVIGIALVAIIGVLPIGMNVQKDNREETVIDQDATVFIEAIRGGASSPFGADLTNYVYAITNFQTLFNNNGTPGATTLYGYTLTSPFETTNNARIIGLLSTPEYTANDIVREPLINLLNGGYSNHVVAYVRSISGPAVEKPPQDNQILQQDSFSYKIICDNVPVAVNTPVWSSTQSYNVGDEVLYNGIWRATAANVGIQPGTSLLWTPNSYAGQLTANLHELRLTFLWPLLPNGDTGAGRQTFRTMVGGQITNYFDNSVPLYFLQSQSFTNAP